MSSLKSILTDVFGRAFEHCGCEGRFGLVVESQRPELCQFQCNGALAASKLLKKNPRELATRVVEAIGQHEAIAQLSIAGPGFVNIVISDAFLAQHINGLTNDPRLGCPAAPHPKTVVIDFGGPNVAKPLHVGHLRPHIIGDCLQRLLRFMGERVISDVHLGDWGTQMGMLICALREAKPDLPYFDAAYTGPYPADSPVTVDELEILYPAASSRCKQDEAAMAQALAATVELQQGRPGYRALWKHFVNVSIAAIREIYSTLGVTFDLWLGESDAAPRIPAMVERLKKSGHAQISEGALVVHVGASESGEEMPPLLLVKRDGGFLYPTTDLATIEQRVQELHAERILYVVDIRQSLHFRQVFRAAHIGGIAPDTDLVHAGFGTMNGPDGKPFKTRDGGTMRLEELIFMVTRRAAEKMSESGIGKELPADEQERIASMVGLAALKYADLMSFRESDYIFDIEKFVSFEGKTGPYLQYTAVRIKSILRKAAEKGLACGAILAPGNAERNCMLCVDQLPGALAAAAEALAPNYICEWAYSLAQEFNRFYRDCHILNEPDGAKQASWLSLVKIVLAQLELALGLLGIRVPERM